MTIVRTDHELLVLNRHFAEDDELSFFARGLLVAILAQPGRWERLDADQLAQGSRAGDGPGPVSMALDELERGGYILREELGDAEDGPILLVEEVYDTPRSHLYTRKPKDEPTEMLPIEAALDRRTCLYRHFDAESILLYVGITEKPGQREAGHARGSIWHGLSAKRTEEWHRSRGEAEAEEMRAIGAEVPLFNIDGNESREAQERVRVYLTDRGLVPLWDIHSRRFAMGRVPRYGRKPSALIAA